MPHIQTLQKMLWNRESINSKKINHDRTSVPNRSDPESRDGSNGKRTDESGGCFESPKGGINDESEHLRSE